MQKIHKLIERELTETEQTTIEHFNYYFDGKLSFALIGETTVVEINKDFDGDIQKMQNFVRRKMKSVVSSHPDFSTYVMDDNYGLVCMKKSVYSVTKETVSDKEVKQGSMDMSLAMAKRFDCIEDCSNAEILAVIEIA